VTVTTATESRQDDAAKAAQRQEEKKRKKEVEESARLLHALDLEDPGRNGAGLRKVRDLAGLSGATADRAVARLVQDGKLEEIKGLEVVIGSGVNRKVHGIRRTSPGGGNE
jgi:hypothetical protein